MHPKRGEVRAEINLLTLIPERIIEWRKVEDDLVELLKPKFRHPLLVKHLLPRMKRPHYRIRLDEFGSYFWRNCDGSRNIEQIATLHHDRFGDKVEPLYDRIGQFLSSLERNGFIRLHDPSMET